MMVLVTPHRIEIKYQSDAADLNTVFSWLQDHHISFFERYEQRRVNSLYFDSDFFECCAENLSGAGNRVKIRYRWYGNDFQPDSGAIEFKFKSHGVGYKRIYSMDYSINLANINLRKLHKKFTSHVKTEDRFWLDTYRRATLLVSYNRRYFESKCGEIRLTIDDDIMFYPQTSYLSLQTKRWRKNPGFIVVEGKFAPEASSLASDVISSLPLRRTRYSKYVSNMVLIYE